MGSWGTGAFQNDDAADWVAELERAPTRAQVLTPLERIQAQGAEGYVEVREASQALAALEIVAAALGRPGATLPDSVKQSLEGVSLTFSAVDVATGLAALERVRGNSEARELWEESPSFAEWQGELDDLERRLRSASPSKAQSEKKSPSAKGSVYRRREGALIEIDLGDGTTAYGRTLGGTEMAFYQLRTKSRPAAAAILAAPIAFRIWVTEREAMRSGRWKVVGHSPLDAALKEPAWYFKRGSLTGKATGLHAVRGGAERPVTEQECRGFEAAAVWRPEHVEDRLRDHFAGRPCKWDPRNRLLGKQD